MSIPKYKERGGDRARRMGLNKPHIFWSPIFSEWVYDFPAGMGSPLRIPASNFCYDQDHRWTPKSKQ